MFTRCPQCDTTFRITNEALEKAHGRVRCGRCSSIFNAHDELREDPRGEPIRNGESGTDTALGDTAPGTDTSAGADAAHGTGSASGAPTAAPGTSAQAADDEDAEERAMDREAALEREPASDDADEGRASDRAAQAEGEHIVLETPTAFAAYTRPLGSTEVEDRGREAAPTVVTDRVDADRVDARRADADRVDARRADADRVDGDRAGVDRASAGRADAPRPFSWTLEAVVETDAPRSRGWLVAASVAALILIGQIAHHFRAELSTKPVVGAPFTALYAALGIELDAQWDVRQYQILDSEAATEPRATGRGSLTIRSRIQNIGPRTQPLPLVRLKLLDRWQETVGTRVFEPSEYLATPRDAAMAAGDAIQAQLVVVDPGPDAYGYEVDVCVPTRADYECANDTVFR